MADITEEDAIEFAHAMGETNPPTNTHLIRQHIDWWQENYPDSFAPKIEAWYTQWIAKVEDEDIDFTEYDNAYQEFMDALDDIPA